MIKTMTGPVSVQDHYSEVRERLVAAVRALRSGDPRREDTFIGPLISEKEAQRVQDWVSEAVSRGWEPCQSTVHASGGVQACNARHRSMSGAESWAGSPLLHLIADAVYYHASWFTLSQALPCHTVQAPGRRPSWS